MFGSVPLVGNFLDTVTGEPVDVNPFQLSPSAAAAFQPTEDQKKFLSYLSNSIYNPTTLPSVSQEQLKQSTDRNLNAMGSAMGSVRGLSNPAIMNKQIINQSSMLGQQANNAAALLRAQEAQNQAKLDMDRQGMFLDAINKQQQNAQDLEKLKAGIDLGNLNAENEARSKARESQLQFLSGLGQAGATIGSQYMGKR